MSNQRSRRGGFCNPAKLPKGPNGRNLCRQCGSEVPPGKLTFCGNICVHDWKMQTSPSYVREAVKERDGGICSVCGLDCEKARRVALAWYYHQAGGLFLDRYIPNYFYQIIKDLWGATNLFQSFWHADHIVPVIEGGGLCGLDNYRTLCLKCHRAETAALRKRLAKKI